VRRTAAHWPGEQEDYEDQLTDIVPGYFIRSIWCTRAHDQGQLGLSARWQRPLRDRGHHPLAKSSWRYRWEPKHQSTQVVVYCFKYNEERLEHKRYLRLQPFRAKKDIINDPEAKGWSRGLNGHQLKRILQEENTSINSLAHAWIQRQEADAAELEEAAR